MPITDRLREDIVIERPTGATDAWGKPTGAKADYATVPGWIQERTGREITAPGLRGTVIADAIVFFASGTDITPADSLRSAAGRRYELLAVRNAGGRTDRGVQADARRIG